MTEDELRSFLEANREAIQAEVKAKMIDSLVATHQWNISGMIAREVSAFMEKEIIPEVRSHLQSEKGPILQAAIKASAELSDQIAKQLVVQATKNINQSYKFSSVAKALFD